MSLRLAASSWSSSLSFSSSGIKSVHHHPNLWVSLQTSQNFFLLLLFYFRYSKTQWVVFRTSMFPIRRFILCVSCFSQQYHNCAELCSDKYYCLLIFNTVDMLDCLALQTPSWDPSWDLQYALGIGSGNCQIPKSEDAQLLYIKLCNISVQLAHFFLYPLTHL
jgi:hypothetical protein